MAQEYKHRYAPISPVDEQVTDAFSRLYRAAELAGVKARTAEQKRKRAGEPTPKLDRRAVLLGCLSYLTLGYEGRRPKE